MQERRFAAEVWDPKGLAIPTWGLRDAALRLKNGSCEDDEPSQATNRAAARWALFSAPLLKIEPVAEVAVRFHPPTLAGREQRNAQVL